MLKRRGVAFVLAVGVLFSLIGVALALGSGSVLLKVSLQKGDVASRTISLTSDSGGLASLEIVGISGVSVSEDNFELEVGESKSVEVSFDSSALDYGVYVGEIKISEGNDVSRVPIILEVESENVLFDVNMDIPPQYSDVEPGEKLLSQVKIFDLTSGGTSGGLGPTTIDSEYYLFSLDGQILTSESESLVVDKQTRITKTVSLPEDIKEGDYVFVSIARYGDSVGTTSQLFSVSARGADISLIEGLGGVVGVGVVLVIGTLVIIFGFITILIIFMIRDRGRVFKELKEYNSRELKMQKALLSDQRRALQKKNIGSRVIKREVKKKVKALKKEHKDRVKEFRKLKKVGKKKDMIRKLEKWKSGGYDTLGMEYKLRDMSSREMEKIMEKWRKKGYK